MYNYDEYRKKMKEEDEKEERMYRRLIISLCVAGALFVIGLIALCCSPASCSRWTKSWHSEWNNGLERTFTVYDYDGEKVYEDKGKLDYEYDNGKWVYDRDGKRTSVSGGIVIVEEVTE